MDISFHLSWWHIPTLITIVSFIFLFIYSSIVSKNDYIAGSLNLIFISIPVLFISMLSWIIGGICKLNTEKQIKMK